MGGVFIYNNEKRRSRKWRKIKSRVSPWRSKNWSPLGLRLRGGRDLRHFRRRGLRRLLFPPFPVCKSVCIFSNLIAICVFITALYIAETNPRNHCGNRKNGEAFIFKASPFGTSVHNDTPANPHEIKVFW